MRILGVIPARYASTRLPGKPLVDIGGMSMVQRVWQRAKQAPSLADVVVATDDTRILEHVQAFGGHAVMTSPQHPSGTDRCWEALELSGAERYDAVVNIQGDEPFIVPDQIEEVCEALRKSTGRIATLAQVVQNDQDLDDPGEVLITTDVHMDALYFSRAAIPFLHRKGEGSRVAQFRYLQHVGIYAFGSAVLKELVALPPSTLELAESLEQLRWVENGFKVRVGITSHASFCVDTQEDVELARDRVRKEGL